ncbi:MAG: hypothetical protein AAF892_06725 [Cyanobacteria bacterium P01_D01_bin.71]
MATEPKDSQQSPAISPPVNSSGASNMVISFLTGSLLVTLMACRTLADALTQVGIASEEVFRGERLPNLQTAPSPEDGQVDCTDED